MGGVEQDLLMVTHPVLCFQNVRFEASLRPPDTPGGELPSSGRGTPPAHPSPRPGKAAAGPGVWGPILNE